MSIKLKLEEFKKPELTDDEIKEFERELGNYQLTAEIENPLEFYGQPFDQFKFNGYVINDILGGVHWSVVDYCLKNKIIGRHRDGSWFVVAEIYEKGKQDGQCITKAYNEFMEKWRGLENLKGRRLYARDMENESFGGGRNERIRKIIEDGRERLKEKTGW